MQKVESKPGVVKFCLQGGHRFLSRDRYASCEACRGKRRKLRQEKQQREEAVEKEKLAVNIVNEKKVTVIDEVLGLGSVVSSKDATVSYHVTLRPPSCTCADTSEVHCEHVRALGRVLGGFEKWNICLVTGCGDANDIQGVPEDLHLDNYEGGEFECDDLFLSSPVTQSAVMSTRAKKVCSSFQRVVSDGSMKLVDISVLEETLKSLKEIYEGSNADKVFKGLKIMLECAELGRAQATAAWDEIQRSLSEAKSNHAQAIRPKGQKARKAKKGTKEWPINEALQPKKRKQDHPEHGEDQETVQTMREEIQADLPGGIMGINKIVLKEGDGRTFPSFGQTVTVHYTASLADNTKVDSSRDVGNYFQFQIGMGRVVKGLDEGVMQMSIGERAVLQCSPDYAYGAVGIPDRIPPNSTMYFDVELFKTE